LAAEPCDLNPFQQPPPSPSIPIRSALALPPLFTQARASLYIYSTREEVDAFIQALASTIDMFQMMED
jgi:selenocysteine lyase/cysteine desulfurase